MISDDTLRDRLLLLGAILGLGLAVVGSINDGPDWGGAPDGGPVAVVNGLDVARADYERALEALARDKKDAITADDRAFVLSRLIDEKLLLARALELKLAENDVAVRKATVAAMIEFIVSDAPPEPVTDDRLQIFFNDNIGLFSTPDRFTVETLFIADASGADQVKQALASGADFAGVEADLGADWAAAPPKSPLGLSALRRYIGDSATKAVSTMLRGEITGPFNAGNGAFFIRLAGQSASSPPAYDAVKDRVAAEWARQAQSAAMDGYLKWLRGRADIRLMDSKP